MLYNIITNYMFNITLYLNKSIILNSFYIINYFITLFIKLIINLNKNIIINY